MTDRAQECIERKIARMFAVPELCDVQQEAAILVLIDPEITALRLQSRLMDIFRSRKWSNSYAGKMPHKAIGLRLMDIDQPDASSPEAGYIDRIMYEALLSSLNEKDRSFAESLYVPGAKQADIMRLYGMSHRWISVWNRNVLDHMREWVREI